MDVKFKQPADILDYPAEFNRFLPDGDTITSATAVIDVVGELAVDALQFPPDGQTVVVWLSGGVDGARYKVTVLANTALGRTKEVDFTIRVRDC